MRRLLGAYLAESWIEGNVCPKSGIEEGSLIDASVVGQRYFSMTETSASQKLTSLNVGVHHVFDPGEEACVIAMNRIGLESSSIGVGCWPSRSEEYCRDQQSGAAALRDGSCSRGGRRCADEGKPILRLRGGGSVLRKQGRRKSCGGRRIKPPAKRQRLAEVGTSGHELNVEGYEQTGTRDLVAQGGPHLDSRLLFRRESLTESEDRMILLAGEAQSIRGRELKLNSLLCRLNVMAGWVSVSEAMTFDEHIRRTSKRSVTPERPYGYRTLSIYHVLLFKALHPDCPSHLVTATKIHPWRLATKDGRTAMFCITF